MIRKSTQKFLFGSLIFLFFLLLILLSYEYLTFENLTNYKDIIKEFVLNDIILSVTLFILLVTIIVNFPVPLAAISKIFSGFIFGFYLGALLNIITTFIGSMVGFYISRYLFKDFFQRKYHSQLEKINPEIQKYGFNYFLSLRILLIFPYFLINILGGISKIKQKTYAMTCILGVIPSSFLYAYAGLQINSIQSPKDIISLEIFLFFLTISLLSSLPAILKHKSVQKKIKKLKKIFLKD